jgi:DICT domain-containing protein
MPSDAGATSRLKDIVYTVDEQVQTLTLCNLAVSGEVVETLVNYFDGQSVSLQRTDAERLPDDFAVLHDGETYVASSPVGDVYEAVRRDPELMTDDAPEEIDVPAVLQRIDETAFTSYDKARMVGASRRIERAAWETGGGELHAGFQYLSNAREQWRLYTRIAVSDVETHLYGADDWDVPPTDIHVHGYDVPEITDTWFVVYDAPDETDSLALLAEERGPGSYHGFWTDSPTVVDAIVGRLRSTYPPTSAVGAV